MAGGVGAYRSPRQLNAPGASEGAALVPFQDNVIVRPRDEREQNGVVLAPSQWRPCDNCHGQRWFGVRKIPCKVCSGRGKVKRDREPILADVIASGPGYHTDKNGAWIPNQTKAGDVILMDPLAGDDWGEFRLLREGTQVIAIIEEE